MDKLSLWEKAVENLQHKIEEHLSGVWRDEMIYGLDVPTLTEAILRAKENFTSICDMAKDPNSYTLKQWNDKVTDLRNYTYLLDALVRDMRKEN